MLVTCNVMWCVNVMWWLLLWCILRYCYLVTSYCYRCIEYCYCYMGDTVILLNECCYPVLNGDMWRGYSVCVDMDGAVAGMLLPRSVYVANVNVVYGGMCGGSRFNAPNDQTFLSSLPTSPTYHITLHHQPSLHSYYQRSLAIIVNNVCKGILKTHKCV